MINTMTKELHLESINVSVANLASENLLEDISDLPRLALEACKICNRQAGATPMQYLTALIGSSVDSMEVILGKEQQTIPTKIHKITVFHPIAYKLKNIIEAFGQLSSKDPLSMKLTIIEKAIIELKDKLIRLGDGDIDHNWDSKYLRELFSDNSTNNSSSLH